MDAPDRQASAAAPADAGATAIDTRGLDRAWIALVALTLLAPLLATVAHGAAALPVLVAAVVWIKGRIVARRFLEAEALHPFLRLVLSGFVAFAPLVLSGLALWPLLRKAAGG